MGAPAPPQSGAAGGSLTHCCGGDDTVFEPVPSRREVNTVDGLHNGCDGP